MKPLRRELLNGLLVLVVASLLSVAFSAFQVSFNAQLWVLILMGIAIAVSGYVIFEIALRVMASAEEREKEWLKRVGTPARLELSTEEMGAGRVGIVEAIKAMSPGSDLTVMYYFGSEGGRDTPATKEVRKQAYSSFLELVKRGTIREYKRIICFENDVLENDQNLKLGVLRVGEGPGTIGWEAGDHCRQMMTTRGCSLYVAPVVVRAVVGLIGVDRASISIETVGENVGSRSITNYLLFSDPPNGEIIEQFRQIERATERRMVAVREIRFPEDAIPKADRTALGR